MTVIRRSIIQVRRVINPSILSVIRSRLMVLLRKVIVFV